MDLYRNLATGRYRAELDDEPGRPHVICDDLQLLEQIVNAVEGVCAIYDTRESNENAGAA